MVAMQIPLEINTAAVRTNTATVMSSCIEPIRDDK